MKPFAAPFVNTPVIDDTNNSTFGCARMTASHFWRCMANPADRIPGGLQHRFVRLSPDGTERQHTVTIGDHRHDQPLSESVLQHRPLQTATWVSAQHLKQTRKRRITLYGAHIIDQTRAIHTSKKSSDSVKHFGIQFGYC